MAVTDDALDGADQYGCCSNAAAGDPILECPAGGQILTLIPRKADNIFDKAQTVKRLLPKRYPPLSDLSDLVVSPLGHVKTIEYNFYPDLAVTRTITAVVTKDLWNYAVCPREQPDPGQTVRFQLGEGTTLPRDLIAMAPAEASTNQEGCAEVKVTLKLTAAMNKALLLDQRKNLIVIVATLVNAAGEEKEQQSLSLWVHRNEDVGIPLGPRENPSDFQTALLPVRLNTTWLIFQPTFPIESEGVKAVRQLLNQVACRKHSRIHHFLAPEEGLFNAATQTELQSLRTSFGMTPIGNQLIDYQRAHFGVRHDPDVLTYVIAEYGAAKPETLLVDGHLLEGQESWVPGSNRRIMPQNQDDLGGADGLLDIYTAVVWPFIEGVRQRATDYATLPTHWCRNPNDVSASNDWPEIVTQGVAYTFGATNGLQLFRTRFPATDTTSHWNEYQTPRFIGLHSTGNTYGVTKNWVVLRDEPGGGQVPLIRGADITAAIAHPPISAKNSIKHNYDANLNMYSGIDCSAFIWRCCLETLFHPEHCSDLANQRIWRNDQDPGRQGTGTWPEHYREILISGHPADRRQISFRSDVINHPGHHIVFLETANRDDIASPAADPERRISLLQARGSVDNFRTNNGQCPRRVVQSNLLAWDTAEESWLSDENSEARHGRLYLWA